MSKCPKCDGCGRVANTDNEEPWTAWANLSLASAGAVFAGLVRPKPCPRCGGSGRSEPQKNQAATTTHTYIVTNADGTPRSVQAPDGLAAVIFYCQDIRTAAEMRQSMATDRIARIRAGQIPAGALPVQVEHWERCACVVCLLPARTDTQWWHRYVMRATEVRLLPGRLTFGRAKHPAPFPSAVVIFEGRPRLARRPPAQYALMRSWDWRAAARWLFGEGA